MNKEAARAQMESDEVAAVRVLKTGDKDMSTRNIMIDDFITFRSKELSVYIYSSLKNTRTHGLWSSQSHSAGSTVHSTWRSR